MNNAKAINKICYESALAKRRLAAGLIRGLSVSDASLQLVNCNLKGGRLLKKTLDSAVANAETQFRS